MMANYTTVSVLKISGTRPNNAKNDKHFAIPIYVCATDYRPASYVRGDQKVLPI